MFFSILGFLSIMVLNVSNDLGQLIIKNELIFRQNESLQQRITTIEANRFRNTDFINGIKAHELEMIEKYNISKVNQK